MTKGERFVNIPCDSMKYLAGWRNIIGINAAQVLSHTLPGYGAAMKVRDVLRLLNDDGWHLAAMQGSHRQYKHPTKSGRVTIAGNLNHDIAPGTLNSIMKQAKLRG